MKPKHRFIDLPIYLENDVLSDPPPLAPKISYQKHADTVPEFMRMLPGTKAEDFSDGEAASVEWVLLAGVLYQLLSPQNPRCLGRLDAVSGHF
jgi:hypothetical protein